MKLDKIKAALLLQKGGSLALAREKEIVRQRAHE